MLLAIDAGNTDIVFGLTDGHSWNHLWRIPSRQVPSREAWQYRLTTELLELDLNPGDIKGAVISSVVPSLTGHLREMMSAINGIKTVVLNSELYPKLSVKVLNTAEIGTDLVANAVAAYHRFQSCCIVVDFGTALTFTSVSNDGEILGVAIAPGLKTAIRALFRHTAQLPEVPLEVPESALGQDTVQAIQAGVVLGYTGLVKNLLEQTKKEVGPNCKVIATGGLSEVLTPIRDHFDEIDRLLTLKGLALVYREVV